MFVRIFKSLASLRLTVLCLALGLILVFGGTLAQVHLGLYEVQARYFRSLVVFWTPEGSHLKIPVFPGGWLIGGVLLVNLIAGHITRFKFSRNKTGIWLAHIGLILLLIGQFFTEAFQSESQMRIEVGETKNYTESSSKVELVVVDTTNPDSDEVTAFPESELSKPEIRNPHLPFVLGVKKFLPNSLPAMARATAPDQVRATRGIGKRMPFISAPAVASMDDENKPAALIEIFSEKGVIGDWLVSTWFTKPHWSGLLQDELGQMMGKELGEPQSFVYNGHSYQIALRMQRSYKPYSLTLKEFHHDVYPGTDIPRNFSSKIHISDPSRGENRDVLIFMNNPLRYGGETFYQSSFEPGDKVSILQVIRNPAASTPYVACSLVAIGLIIQFMVHLFGFAKVHDKKPHPIPDATMANKAGDMKRLSSDTSNLLNKWLPWIFVAVFASWFLFGTQKPELKEGFNVAGFGQLPALLNGRVQPLDSLGRNALLSMLGKSAVRVKDGPSLSPSGWLLEALANPQQADQRKIFRLQHPDLEGMISAQKIGLQYYSYNELTNHTEQIEAQVNNLSKAEEGRAEASKNRTPFQKDLMHLYESLNLYQRIKNTAQPSDSPDFEREIRDYKASIGPGRLSAQGKAATDSAELQKLSGFFNRYQEIAGLAYARTIPPLSSQPQEAWATEGSSLMETVQTDEIHPAVLLYAKILSAYRKNQPAEFNQALADYQAWLQSNGLAPAIQKSRLEFTFNQLEPFYKATVIYVAALLLGCVFWMNLSEPLRRAGFALLVLAFIIHTIGLGMRMYLEGRPPVTNLYSSAVFIGWGSVLLGLMLERIFKGGIGLVASAFIGFVTLIIAHHLSLSGDTMEMMRAVLDSNFWLATHVVTVTVGYSSMFIAGLLAIIYILRGFFTSLSSETAKSLSRMVYGIVCFATLFSFIGTVLGGIWADQSWGRFWGWDPKENGALLIVIWNATILHARWAGMIRDKGLMIMAVFGNIVTSFSWFGVNMLGVGLHSYGFMDEAFNWLMLFIASQVILILIALFPDRLWKSRAAHISH